MRSTITSEHALRCVRMYRPVCLSVFCSVVFWLGDLNYRIQTSEHFNSEMVKKLSDNFQLQKLLEFDQVTVSFNSSTRPITHQLTHSTTCSPTLPSICLQLTIQKRENKVFEDYTEGKIDFKPTYKYDTGTDRWDTR